MSHRRLQRAFTRNLRFEQFEDRRVLAAVNFEGIAWNDHDQDGIRQADEAIVSDVLIHLLDANDNVLESTRTDLTGHYIFYYVPADTSVRLMAVAPPGTEFSPNEQGTDDSLDSDFDPVSGRTAIVSAPTGETRRFDVGLFGAAAETRVSGKVWDDLNGDGLRTSNEPSLEGVIIRLLDGRGIDVRTAMSDQSGGYAFAGLEPGRYRLEIVPPKLSTLSPMDRGNDDRADSDFNRGSNQTPSFYLVSDQTYLSQDAGVFRGSFVDLADALGQTVIYGRLPITEIMSSVNDGDFLEIKNDTEHVIRLNGLEIGGDIGFSFQSSRVEFLFPGEYVLVVSSSGTFHESYDAERLLVAGDFGGGLDNRGGTIRPSWRSSFQYDGWQYAITDDAWFSLTVSDEQAPDWHWNDPSFWRPSSYAGGTPGAADPLVTPGPGSIVINEVMSNPEDGYNDWVELRNTTNQDIDISYWYLGDDNDGSLRFQSYQFPDGTIVPAGGYLTVTRADDFRFGISSFGEFLQLTAGDFVGRLLGYSVSVRVPSLPHGITAGLVGGDLVPLGTPTFGSANANPRTSPVVINEIMYQPGFLRDEFVELLNTSMEPVDIGGWFLRSGDGLILLEFPMSSVLPAGGYGVAILVAPEEFHGREDLPPGTIILHDAYQSYGNSLGNGSVDLRLFGWDSGHPYVADRVHYDDVLPWPEEADLGGGSLERLNPNVYGNDPSNWHVTQVRDGTPGRANSTKDIPVDLAVSIEANNPVAAAGEVVSYTIDVTNQGDIKNWGATVGLPPTNASTYLSWTCMATPGSSCPSDDGSGAVNVAVDVAPGGHVAFTVLLELAPQANGYIDQSVHVDAGGGHVDRTLGNNESVARMFVVPRLPGPTITVTLPWDEIDDDLRDEDISLREALKLARADSIENTIVFAPEISNSTLMLDPGLGELVIDSDVVIVGPGMDELTIDAQGRFRVLRVDSEVTAAIEQLSITGGVASVGAGVANAGILTLRRVRVHGNQATSSGGGIASDGDLWLVGSMIESNDVTTSGGGDVRGGGLFVSRGRAIIESSILARNVVRGAQGPLSSAMGGGIFAGFAGLLVVTRSSIFDNSAIGDQTVGGGIYSETADFTLEQSTVSGNQLIVNLSGALGFGGGIFLSSSGIIKNSTILGNQILPPGSVGSSDRLGGGIYTAGVRRRETLIHESVIAGNSYLGRSDDVVGFFDTSSRSNFVGDAFGSTGLIQAGSIFGSTSNPANPRLSPPGQYGGLTPTHVPLPGSPVIDAGPNASEATGTDQRSARFLRVVGNRIDIGATEFQVAPIDFVSDGEIDCADIEALNAMIISGSASAVYDLSGDGLIDGDDVNVWLSLAGLLNRPSHGPFVVGDANLDGFVDADDFDVWRTFSFSPGAWCSGDFNTDGSVDVADFNLWHANRFTGEVQVLASDVPARRTPRSASDDRAKGVFYADQSIATIDCFFSIEAERSNDSVLRRLGSVDSWLTFTDAGTRRARRDGYELPVAKVARRLPVVSSPALPLERTSNSSSASLRTMPAVRATLAEF